MSYEVSLKIDGIKCAGCFNRINREINSEKIDRADINHSRKIVTLYYSNDKDIYKQVVENIERAGYSVRVISINNVD